VKVDALVHSRSGRRATVAENLRHANGQDLDGVLGTYSIDARLEDEAADERHVGHQAVRGYYERLFVGIPDLAIDVRAQHESDEVTVVECWFSGTHLGMYWGMPETNRRLLFPACFVFAFDEAAKLALARLYYDAVTPMRQIGIFHP
jgi:predicted ester cyclase